jgi:DNA-binding CsgD family transcriptional regulator
MHVTACLHFGAGVVGQRYLDRRLPCQLQLFPWAIPSGERPQPEAGMTRQDSQLTKAPYSQARERDLSERELEIIGLVAEGLTNQEIATSLTISKRTVDNHVSNIFTKTGAKNRVALLNWAMDHGKVCRDGFNCCALDGEQGPDHPA